MSVKKGKFISVVLLQLIAVTNKDSMVYKVITNPNHLISDLCDDLM